VYRRPLQTNEPINDRAVLTDVETSVIAAIGPLNSRKEANAHAIRDKTTGECGVCVTVRYCSMEHVSDIKLGTCGILKITSRLVFDNIKVKMRRTVILPLVFMHVKLGSPM
jgi:hypothetical protein